MTLILVEGFDHFQGLSELNDKGWTSGTASPGDVGPPGSGRVPGVGVNGRAFHIGFSSDPIYKFLPGSYNEIVWGMGFKSNSVDGVGDFCYYASSSGVEVFAVGLVANKLVVYDSTGTAVGTGTTSYMSNNWHYVEVKINVSAGSLELRLDGNPTPEISVSGADFGGAPIDRITLRFMGFDVPGCWYDDIYVEDTSSGPNDDFLGDVVVETLFPAADGFHHDWVPDIGTDHFSRVNEPIADGDASVVTSKITNDIDTYTMFPLGIVLGSIYGAQLNLYARKNDASVRQIRPIVRQAGTDHVFGATETLSTDYIVYSYQMDQDPTSADWTISTINDDEYGIDLVT